MYIWDGYTQIYACILVLSIYFVQVGGPSLQSLANLVNYNVIVIPTLDSHHKLIRWRIVTHTGALVIGSQVKYKNKEGCTCHKVVIKEGPAR